MKRNWTMKGLNGEVRTELGWSWWLCRNLFSYQVTRTDCTPAGGTPSNFHRLCSTLCDSVWLETFSAYGCRDVPRLDFWRLWWVYLTLNRYVWLPQFSNILSWLVGIESLFLQGSFTYIDFFGSKRLGRRTPMYKESARETCTEYFRTTYMYSIL